MSPHDDPTPAPSGRPWCLWPWAPPCCITGFIPRDELTYLWPTLLSLVDLVLVSALFRFRGTALLGLLLNSFLAFLGIIMMADYSLCRHPGGPGEGQAGR